METNRKLKLDDIGFWPKWFGKLLFTLISVKVWGLIAGTIVSTWLLLVHVHHTPAFIGGQLIEYGINGAQWVTFNTTIWALIFGMKEIYRISEQHDISQQDTLRESMNSRIKLAEMMTCDNNPDEDETIFEKAGDEPDEL